jgi:hypothetical protein
MDLLINGSNDPNVPAKITVDHMVPGILKSEDRWMDAYNWGVCNPADLYMQFKDVESVEAGRKLHVGTQYVYDGVADGSGTLPLGVPDGYRAATGDEPKGAGVWSSEPEKISEVGGGWIGQYYIEPAMIPDPANPPDGMMENPEADLNLLGEDYASGIADHLSVLTEVPKEGSSGDVLGDPDTNNDGVVDETEYAAWTTNGNRWVAIASLSGKLATIAGNKDFLGTLATQAMTFIHVTVRLQQIQAEEWANYPTSGGVDYDGDNDIDADDEQKSWWPTNALQGDMATWDMLFELTTDP